MHPKIEFALVLVTVALVAFLGALASKHVRLGGHWLWYYSTGLVSIGTWTWLARRSPYNLVVSSMSWDIAYNVAWLGTVVVVLKEASSIWQVVGAVIIVVGLTVMSI